MVSTYEIKRLQEDIEANMDDAQRLDSGRAVSIVITKLEEAILWLTKVPTDD
jgi:hypothetical protein